MRTIVHFILLCRGLRWNLLLVTATALTLAHSPTNGETLYSDDTIEISADGPRASRDCVLTLKPIMTLGDNQAPRLTLTTRGYSRLVLGLENEVLYEEVAVVQDNIRRPFLGTEISSASDFRNVDVLRALSSGKLFYVTGRLRTGRHVSSRFDGINIDKALEKINEDCPFDAEILMSDTSERRRIEQSLNLSSDDLKSIRWALSKRYENADSEPSGDSMTSQERGYLKRYAQDKGLRISQYLTSETAHPLISEGQAVAAQAIPPPPPPPPPEPEPVYWNAVAAGIWESRGRKHVAIGYSGIHTSAEAAEASALEACRGVPGRNCRPAGTWNFGCIYIAYGTSRRGVRWVVRADKDETLNECRSGGYRCPEPLGGCVD